MVKLIEWIKSLFSMTTPTEDVEEEINQEGVCMTNLQLTVIAPSLKIDYDTLSSLFNKYDITNNERIAQFFAQCGHESGDFKHKEENLNYSAEGLLKVFPKYFNADTVAPYARNKEKIANKVYASRMGNGDENTGDGWKFRGRGFIQLTGKNNYTAFANDINKSIDDTITYLTTTEGAIESALWYWKSRNINALCDKVDHKAVCKAINGGYNGLEDRIKRYDYAMKVLNS